MTKAIRATLLAGLSTFALAAPAQAQQNQQAVQNAPQAQAQGELPDQSTTPNHPLTPRHLRLHDLFEADAVARTDVVTGRRLVLGNGDVRISYVVAAQASPWYRNGIGDACRNGAKGVRSVMPCCVTASRYGPGGSSLPPLTSAGTKRSSLVVAPMIFTWSPSLKNLVRGSP